METYIDCNDCKNVSLTEDDQMDNRQPHICMRYGVRVFHNTSKTIHASYLKPCMSCRLDDFREFRGSKLELYCDKKGIV